MPGNLDEYAYNNDVNTCYCFTPYEPCILHDGWSSQKSIQRSEYTAV